MPFNSNNEWVPESDNVADRVTALTAQDSPLMQQATGMGIRQANRRGLSNSSIAAGASRAATLSAAVPIASQDASQIASRNLARISGDYNLTGTRLTLESNERQGAADRAAGAFSNYSQQIASINSNPRLRGKARSAQLTSATDALRAQLGIFQNLYPAANISWSSGAAPTGTAGG